MKKPREWTEEELAYLRANYPTESAVDIADHLGLSSTTIRNKAVQLGIKKSPDYDKNRYRNRYVSNYKHGWYHNAKTACIIMLSLFLCGYSSTKYVPVETVSVDTIYQSKLQHDSIHIRDSVFVKEWQKGDTIFVNRDRWRIEYLSKEVHDTIYKSKIDSIAVPYPVEKELTWWERQKIAFGELAMIIMAGLLCFVVIRFRK